MFNNKYEPTTFNELVFTDAVTRFLLEQYATGGRCGNVLLHGTYGTGKTTAANVIVKSAMKDSDWSTDEYHGAELNSKSFKRIIGGWDWQIANGAKYGYCIINELDMLMPLLQNEVRALMDNYKGIAGFIFTTNNLHNVQTAFKSRCEVVEIEPLTAASMLNRAKYILTAEGVTVDDKKLSTALATCDGDMRNIERTLENIVLRIRIKQQKAA